MIIKYFIVLLIILSLGGCAFARIEDNWGLMLGWGHFKSGDKEIKAELIPQIIYKD